VIFGHIALNEIKKSSGAIEGQGLALAGLIIGYIGLGLGLICSCVFIFLPILAAILNGGTTTGFIGLLPL